VLQKASIAPRQAVFVGDTVAANRSRACYRMENARVQPMQAAPITIQVT
jgi:hypothetical protein